MQTVLGSNGQIGQEVAKEIYRKYSKKIRLVGRHPKKIHPTDELISADLMEYSCLKTIASKHKGTLSKTISMFKDGNGSWGIPYETKQGKRRRYFAKFSECKSPYQFTDKISQAPVLYGYSRNTLENRLKAKFCELCGTTDETISYEIHHVNKVKNLKGKEKWEMAMIAKQRKTLVVCFHCHRHVIHKHK